jgi:myosin heavy subunit
VLTRACVAEQALQQAAALFGVSAELLLESINHKTVQMGGKRASIVKVPQNADQATQIRDALAKEMYSRIFDFVVSKVNYSMRSQGYPGNTLGILDIYGFEIFDHNLFEQLCINFVNERLQQIFLDAVVKGEQQLYIDQGLPWKQIDFFDNQAICELIEGNKVGRAPPLGARRHVLTPPASLPASCASSTTLAARCTPWTLTRPIPSSSKS